MPKYEGETRLAGARLAISSLVFARGCERIGNLAGVIVILGFSIRCQAVHILFTPALFPRCQRLEIRNEENFRQENFGSLFCFLTQKNLD
jgi:hypothetical protein